MDAKMNEMAVAAFSNIEEMKVELLRRLEAAKTKEEIEKVGEVLDAVNQVHTDIADLRVLVKKNF